VILRAMNELVDGPFGSIRRIHGLLADDTFCGVTVALGAPRICHGVKGSAAGAKESPALGDRSCERHVGASVYPIHYAPRMKQNPASARACKGLPSEHQLPRCGSSVHLTTALGRVSRVTPVQTALRNCTRDEGRSFEAGSQVLASNRCKLLSSRAMVVSVAVNVGRISRRVRLREASASEPLMNCRKRFRRCQNRGVTLPPIPIDFTV
jgi:hypothetical protein